MPLKGISWISLSVRFSTTEQRLISSTTMEGNAAVHKEFPADNRSVFPSSKMKTESQMRSWGSLYHLFNFYR